MAPDVRTLLAGVDPAAKDFCETDDVEDRQFSASMIERMLPASVAQRSRHEKGPAIDHQLLLYPVVRRDFGTASYEQFATGHFLTRATMQSFWEHHSAFAVDRSVGLC
jgi:hypothetical protein